MQLQEKRVEEMKAQLEQKEENLQEMMQRFQEQLQKLTIQREVSSYWKLAIHQYVLNTVVYLCICTQIRGFTHLAFSLDCRTGPLEYVVSLHDDCWNG